MAYPFYQSYQPQYQTYYPYQPVQQPQQTYTPSANQPVPPTQVSNVWIYNEAEIPNYPVAPNNAVRLWVTNKPVFYEKSADATGKPTIKIFDYAERKETASDGVSESADKTPAYATKEELKAVVEAVKGFGAAITSAQSDIDSLKGDMYGIAGKKKSAKKPQEVVENDE